MLSLMAFAIGYSAKPTAGLFSWGFKLLAANANPSPKRDCHAYVAANTNSGSQITDSHISDHFRSWRRYARSNGNNNETHIGPNGYCTYHCNPSHDDRSNSHSGAHSKGHPNCVTNSSTVLDHSSHYRRLPLQHRPVHRLQP